MIDAAFDYRRLGLAERLQLVEDVRDSVAEGAQDAPGALPLGEARRAEGLRRREAHRRDPGSAIPRERAREERLGRGG